MTTAPTQEAPIRETALVAPVDSPEGLWNTLRAAAPQPGSPEARGLAGIGYAGGYDEPSEMSGALTLHADRIQPGLTLFSSGHAPMVVLIDSEGEVVHQWHIPFEKVWPSPLPFEVLESHQQFIRRAVLYPNGDILVVFEYIGIAKVDKNGKVLWNVSRRCHHDIQVLPDGRILTLTLTPLDPEQTNERFPGLKMPEGLFDNSVLLLSENGSVLQEDSIVEAFFQSPYGVFLSQLPWDQADLLHANSVDWIGEELAAAHPYLEPDSVLLSLRNAGALAALDLETSKISWLEVGQWKMQHQAKALPNGNILMMDNRGGNPKRPLWFDRSRALEYHAPSQTAAWQFPKPKEKRIYTDFLGYIQRQPNGNTLITESTQGHLIEVDGDGVVLWEYYSPFRAGPDRSLIATIMGAQRVARETLTFLK